MAVAGCDWNLTDVGCRCPNADVSWNAAVAHRSYTPYATIVDVSYSHAALYVRLLLQYTERLASEVLVFMAVGLSGRWKLPCAFFFTDHMNADQQTNFVLDCMKRLHHSGITVRTVTCDGTEVNMKMFKNFGITVENPSFRHPCDSSINIFAVFDVCHMIKLLRNTLADLKILRNGQDMQIHWQYIQKLLDCQENAGIRAANKLRTNHVNFHKLKMKVKLAVQVLSNSVADALEFLAH
jgi:hypothetical protein